MAKIIIPWLLLFAIGGFVTAVLGVVLGWMVIPPVVKDQIKGQLVISEGTPQYDRWTVIPQPIIFKVYIFNVTNADAVHRGEELPRVQEVGPYIYKQYRRKENIKFSKDKNRVTFKNRMNFQFDQELSGTASENDEIVVLNTIMNVVLQQTEYETKHIVGNILVNKNNITTSNPVMQIIKRVLGSSPVKTILQVTEQTAPAFMASINLAVDAIFGQKTLFLRTSVRKYLFDGIPFCVDPGVIGNVVCNIIRQKKSKSVFEFSKGLKFAYFYHKNTTDNGLFTSNTGLSDISKVGKVETWNEQSLLSIWNYKSIPTKKPARCNMVNGTDAGNFAPYRKVSNEKSLYLWSPDICRSVEMHFKRLSDYKGITSHRFEMAGNFVNELGPEWGTECFCINQIPSSIVKPNGCLFKGALDLSPCVEAPMVLTMPHMLNAAQEYTNSIQGFSPDPKKHDIFLEIEPNTGVPLQGSTRVQFNMFIRKIDHIDITNDLKTMLMPVLWIDEGLELNDEFVGMLNNNLIRVLFFLDIFIWGMIIVGILMGIGLSYWYYRKRKTVKGTATIPIQFVK